MDGAQVPVEVAKATRVRDLRRQRRQAGHEPDRLPALRRPRRRLRRARGCSRSASRARSAAARARSSRSPCETCGGSGLTAQRKRYRVNVPAGVRDGTRIRLAGKGEDGPLGGPPGDLYVTTRVAPSPVFKQRPDGNLEVTVPITIAEAIQGATVEVPTLHGTKRIRVPGGHPARHRPAAARRRPAQARRQDPRRHLLPARDRGPARPLARAEAQASRSSQETLNDHDPRERLLRQARRAGDRSEESGKVGAS